MQTHVRPANTKLRVGIFLEENLLNCARRPDKRPVLLSIMGLATEVGEIVHASAHLSFSPRHSLEAGTDKFITALEQAGLQVDLRPRGLVANCEKSRVDQDISLAVGLAVIEKKIDVVILGTGDSDYVNVIETLKSRGIPTLVLCPSILQTSKALLKVATTFVGIDELLREKAYAA